MDTDKQGMIPRTRPTAPLAAGGAPVPDGLLSIPVATAVVAADGRILHWSPDAEALLGHPASEAVGARAADILVGPERRKSVLELFGRILSGHPWSGVFPVRHRDGHSVQLDFRTYPVLGQDGRPMVLAVASDVGAVRRLASDLAVLDGFFTQSPVGMSVFDTELRFVRLNEALAAINGVPVEQHLHRRLTEVVPGIDGQQAERVMRRVLATGTPELDIRTHGWTPADPEREHAWSASCFRLEQPDGTVLGVSTTIVDITSRFEAETAAAAAQDRLALLNEASTRIGTTLDLATTARELAETATPRLADTVVVEVLDDLVRGEAPSLPDRVDRSAVLRRLAFHTVPGSGMTPIAAEGTVQRFHPSTPYAWALSHGRPVLLPRTDEPSMSWFADDPVRGGAIRSQGVRSLMVVPLIARGAAIGTATFFRSRTDVPYDHSDLALASELAGRAAVSIDNALLYTRERDAAEQRQRALEAAEAAQQRLALLNEASTRIGTTLDLSTTAQELVEVVLPRFADFVTVDIREAVLTGEDPEPVPESGSVMLRAVAVGERDGGVQLAGAADEVGMASRSAQLYAQAMRTGRSILVPHVDEFALRRIVAHPDRIQPSLEAGVHSYLMVPLLARGQVLGGVEFVRVQNPEPFTSADLALGEELAARAAVCIDNSRLYRRERDTALTLQRSLLPQDVHRTPGLEIAYRYLPSSVGDEVGGDWFDVVPLTGGRVALIVGDVMGHGIRAAATMGQLRTVARTLVTLDLDPARVLRRLDEATAQLGADQFATCVCAVFDPVDEECILASAGHLPPVVSERDGEARLVTPPPGAPLGVGGVPFESVRFPLREDGLLVLYTDGLVERRGQDLDQGLELLRETVTRRQDTLERGCDAVLGALGATLGQDDVAVIMAHAGPVGADQLATLALSGDPALLRHARDFTRRTLTGWGLASLVEPVVLLTGELLANALLHAGSPLQLRVFRGALLTVEVSDADSREPRLRPAGEHDEGGRGMVLINELAHRWGSRATRDGKVVWFEMELPVRSSH
ncbi:SpoIIE family protein phosphatase [Streptomyces sp. TLI_171]|uniref:SpoIIE family protein phosphatase n=1 Tax=Streptomyces sp. TLI_171 TaxID=1938859 RepID=UPI000C189CA4|nr:SpoIIE family protein phosphatase [Streptomyces sp. TLI_171]RKE17156.1 PAS domain S-box-containing protein [Streptomyces sp. TLI_171]